MEMEEGLSSHPEARCMSREETCKEKMAKCLTVYVWIPMHLACSHTCGVRLQKSGREVGGGG